jgi:hypothetical protein
VHGTHPGPDGVPQTVPGIGGRTGAVGVSGTQMTGPTGFPGVTITGLGPGVGRQIVGFLITGVPKSTHGTSIGFGMVGMLGKEIGSHLPGILTPPLYPPVEVTSHEDGPPHEVDPPHDPPVV